MSIGLIAIVIILAVVLLTLFKCVRIVPQGQLWLVERLGRYHKQLNAGLNIVIPFVDSVAYRLSTKDQIMKIPSQEVISKDNAVLSVNAITYVKVVDAQKAAYGVENYQLATVNLAMTSLRAAIGKLELDESLSQRDEIRAALLNSMADQMTDWGLELRSIEIQDINPSESMQESMEEQAAAERKRKATETMAAGNKRAAILEAEGVKESTVLRAQADKEAAVLHAEAHVSEAEGIKKANELLAELMNNAGGEKAMQFQLATRYISALSSLGESENAKIIAMPADLNAAVSGLVGSGVALGAGSELAK
ncbi:SPFH domain-containing protein (plasmid) [Providencia huaxiensis]|uniref:SPFH/Band 7/PHB domain protein n=5 Tax=Enterobacterales TaxID=91347 RepID=A0AA42JZ77_9GAMM|nr:MULTISPECIES: SPFH domain-containing protein [Enterobacterales]ELB1214751.1 SPFH/Band 7/PHB domain protein [Proteus mirabilis]ELY4881576.1 SPFH/Band 7/PHB domain protein [Morganella morganii]SPY66780.1 FtsH protease regulator HflK [Providencia stuartii]SUC33833.1 FtsH protease regulator HflK [Providencia rustigianii]HAZ7869400.1 SPFH/Band 7/PHB domain protein [Escherichia coli]